jgi:uncharacterized membrane protein
LATAPTSADRLVGLDVARCLALLGMVATHVLDERSPDGTVAPLQWLAGGRASALFAVLAGVSLALMTGRREPVRGGVRVRPSAGLALRALLIAAIGLALGGMQSGIAVILTYYGVLFLAGLPFLGLRTRALAVLATLWVVAAPVLSHLARPALPERGTASPTVAQLADPWQLGTELLLTGYYPVVPWLAYLLVGIALGRADLRSPRLQAALAAGGLGLAVGATALSRVLTAQDHVVDPLLSAEPAYGTREELLDSIATGMFGTTPTGAWEWLLVVAPHSGTPFDLAQTIGSAVAAIGACLLVLHRLPPLGRVGTGVLFGAGTMTLTLYSLHVVMRSPWVWPPEEPDSFRWHVLVLLAVGALYAAAGRRGPLERVATWLTRLPNAREPEPPPDR